MPWACFPDRPHLSIQSSSDNGNPVKPRSNTDIATNKKKIGSVLFLACPSNLFQCDAFLFTLFIAYKLPPKYPEAQPNNTKLPAGRTSCKLFCQYLWDDNRKIKQISISSCGVTKCKPCRNVGSCHCLWVSFTIASLPSITQCDEF